MKKTKSLAKHTNPQARGWKSAAMFIQSFGSNYTPQTIVEAGKKEGFDFSTKYVNNVRYKTKVEDKKRGSYKTKVEDVKIREKKPQIAIYPLEEPGNAPT